MGELDQQMIDRIKEQTNNRVNINPFFDGTLVEPTDWYQELLNGSANIVQGNVGSEKIALSYSTPQPCLTME